MYKALPEQTAGDLAYAAAENLFEHIKIDRQKIGALILVTQSPDYSARGTCDDLPSWSVGITPIC